MMPIAMLSPSPQPARCGIRRVARLGTASLERLALGSLKPGRIHSVFERAVNVLWGDGHLLTLHGPGPLAAPFAIALERLPARGAVALGMAIGPSDFEWSDAEPVVLEMPGGPLGFGGGAPPAPRGAPAVLFQAG